MKSSPLLTEELVRIFYRDRNLANELLDLEKSVEVIDQSGVLSNLVNTSLSKAESLSRWVRYREGYSPAIVQNILQTMPIDPANQYILDPMCGSGSTQVSAQQSNVFSGGTDVSPYAVLVSQVKTTALTDSDIQLVNDFVEKVKKVKLPKKAFNQTEEYLVPYFPKSNLQVLVDLKRLLFQQFVRDSKVRRFLFVSLLAIIEESSNRKKDGNGLATRESKIRDPLKLYVDQVEMMLADLRSASWMNVPSKTFIKSALSISATISELDSQFNKTLGAIIFSPPYANSFDYYESYKLELLFGEFFDSKTISEERKLLIRSYRQMGKSLPNHQLPKVESLIGEIMSRLPDKEASTGTKDGRARLLPNMLRGYFQDMRSFISSSAAAMPQGSYMAIVVDQSAYLGVLVPTDLLLADIGISAGLTFEKLIICRKAKTSGQQMNMQPALGEALRETAVILRK